MKVTLPAPGFTRRSMACNSAFIRECLGGGVNG
jgi:hypothetical protein